MKTVLIIIHYTYNSNQCLDSLTKNCIEYKKALYVPNALYPSAANYEVSRFVLNWHEKYRVEYDLFGNVIWESTA